MSDPGRLPQKSAAAFRTIGEVAEELDLPTHVLRFWETKFPQIKPVKRSGGRRYYRPEDLLLLRRIRQWLHQDGYTIRGVQQLLENAPPPVAGTGDNPAETDPAASAPPDTEIDPGAGLPAKATGETADRPPPSAPIGDARRAAALDPATRAELEAIRGELLEARALLDALLRHSKAS